MQGFGTVVTGTLLDGTLHAGETLEAVPGGPSARIRGLQTHQQQVDEAQPGTRVAINLAGVGTDELRRGQVLAPPGQVGVARTVDAVLRVLPERALRHNLRVTVHLGAAETQGRLRVLGADEVGAGSEGWCQIQLAPPIAAAPGDLFVVRVSDRTLAGGRVLAVNTDRHRRTDPAVIERLRALAEGNPDAAALAALERIEPATVAELARHADLEADALTASIESLVGAGDVITLDGGESRYVSAAGAARLRTRATRALEAYEREHPLRRVMTGEELRARLGLDVRAFEAVLPALAPDVVAESGGVRREGWSPQPTAAQRRAAQEAVAALAAGGVSPPRIDLDPELAAYLEDRGEIVDCGDGVMLAAEAFAGVSRTVVALIEAEGSATLAQLRDAIGTNRRATQAMLERLDRDGVTRRRGDERVLARTPA